MVDTLGNDNSGKDLTEKERRAREYENEGRFVFTDQHFSLPFGKYQTSADAEEPNHEFMVGRERERAAFIEQLSKIGSRGAFLITGRRGVGKSSFVSYCLRNYRDDVFGRFLTGSVGRTIWDIVSLVILFGFVVISFLLLSEASDYFLEIANNHNEWTVYLVAIPVSLLCFIPILYSFPLFSAIFPAHNSKKIVESLNFKWPVLFALFSLNIYLGYFCLPMGSPTLGVSRIILGVSVAYWLVNLASFKSLQNIITPKNRFFKIINNNIIKLLELVLYVVFIYFALFGFSHFTDVDIKTMEGNTIYEVFFNVMAAHVFGWFGFLARCIRLGWLKRSISRYEENYLNHLPPLKYLVNVTIQSVITISTIFIVSFFLLGEESLTFDEIITKINYLYGTLVCFAIPITVFFSIFIPIFLISPFPGPSKNSIEINSFSYFCPTPKLAIVVTASVYLFIGLQLAFPAISFLQEKANIEKFFGQQVDNEIWLSEKQKIMEPSSLYKFHSSDVNNKIKVKFELEEYRDYAPNEYHLRPIGNNSQNKLKDNRIAPQTLFWSSAEEGVWVLLVMFLVGVLFFIQYEWVVRPFSKERQDTALDRGGRSFWGDQRSDLGSDRSSERAAAIKLERATLPWLVYQIWMPSLVATVNLGFEHLNPINVIQAMLYSLRTEYERVFMAWDSGLGNLHRFVSILVGLFLISQGGEMWFSVKVDSNGEKLTRPAFAAVLDAMGEDSGLRKIMHALVYYPVFSVPITGSYGSQYGVLLRFLHENRVPNPEYRDYRTKKNSIVQCETIDTIKIQNRKKIDAGTCSNNGASLSFRGYHLFLLMMVLALFKYLNNNLPVFTYRRNYNKILMLAEGLTSSISREEKREHWKPVTWVASFFVDQRNRSIKHGPFDPRTAELAFIELLESIQKTQVSIPFFSSAKISTGSPEITFVFDELDKLVGRTEPGVGVGSREAEQEVRVLMDERQRSLALQQLLSDMKRVISTAPARFIFVGGRLLHDEWMADQTARQPLLTSIFDNHIYVPSLLLDHKERAQRSLSLRVQQLFAAQYQRSVNFYQTFNLRRWNPFLQLSSTAVVPESFDQSENAGDRSEVDRCIQKISENWKHTKTGTPLDEWLFFQYLPFEHGG